MEIWDMMINITRARADKAFRELDYEAFTELWKLLEEFDEIKKAYGKGEKIRVVYGTCLSRIYFAVARFDRNASAFCRVAVYPTVLASFSWIIVSFCDLPRLTTKDIPTISMASAATNTLSSIE